MVSRQVIDVPKNGKKKIKLEIGTVTLLYFSFFFQASIYLEFRWGSGTIFEKSWTEKVLISFPQSMA